MASQLLVWQMLMYWMYCWTVIKPLLLKSNTVYPTIVSNPENDSFHARVCVVNHSLTPEKTKIIINNWIGLNARIASVHCSVSQNSLCVTSKLAQMTVERENGCLGLTLRGGGEFPLIVTNVRPHGPVFKIGRIKPGDRLLRVDNVSLAHPSQSMSVFSFIYPHSHLDFADQ